METVHDALECFMSEQYCWFLLHDASKWFLLVSGPILCSEILTGHNVPLACSYL